MWLALDVVGLLAAMVLFLTAVRLFEVSRPGEVSIRSAVAVLVGVGAAWSIAAALEPGHLHPAHALVLFSGACWVGQALWRHRGAPVRHAGRRQTDYGDLDPLTSGPKK